MKRCPLPAAGLLLAAGLMLFSPSGVAPLAGAPTAPPPPRATGTPRRQPRPHPTSTPSREAARAWPTPTLTAAGSPTATGTPTASATMPPTPTPSTTPTPYPNLHVLAYLDRDANGLFDAGEGINDLLLLASAGEWAEQAVLQNGELWLALPRDLPPGSPVQVQSPYLHWSERQRAPAPGAVLEIEARLELPQFPISLP